MLLIYNARNRVGERRRLNTVQNNRAYRNLTGIAFAARFRVDTFSQKVQIRIGVVGRASLIAALAAAVAAERVCAFVHAQRLIGRLAANAVRGKTVLFLELLDRSNRICSVDTDNRAVVVSPFLYAELTYLDLSSL